MITSKLTRKAQTTVPQPIRVALHLRAGDELVYRIEGETAVLSRARLKGQRIRLLPLMNGIRMLIGGPMPGFDTWDIIKVPFPYTDRPVRERRPALVVATNDLQEPHGLMWVLMITSAQNRRWPSDVSITDLRIAGLPADSVVRTAKIATIETKEAECIGVLPEGDRAAVTRRVRSCFDFRE